MYKIFCANCQLDTDQSFGKDSYSGEYIAVCSLCDRALKFPADINKEKLTVLLDEQKRDNIGQQKIEPAEVGPPDVIVSEEVAVPVKIMPPADPVPIENMPPLDTNTGPRAQDNLTPSEQMVWDQIKQNTSNAT